MPDEKTFTDAKIDEAIEYLESQGFDRPQGRALASFAGSPAP